MRKTRRSAMPTGNLGSPQCAGCVARKSAMRSASSLVSARGTAATPSSIGELHTPRIGVRAMSKTTTDAITYRTVTTTSATSARRALRLFMRPITPEPAAPRRRSSFRSISHDRFRPDADKHALAYPKAGEA